MKNIITIIVFILVNSVTMNAQTDYSQILGDDSTEVFEPSFRMGFRTGTLLCFEPGIYRPDYSDNFKSYEFEMSNKLTEGIDLTFTFQNLKNDSGYTNQYGNLDDNVNFGSIGITLIPFRKGYISPIINFSTGIARGFAFSLSGGVHIPFHFVDGGLEIRYQRLMFGQFVSFSGITAGMNIGL